MREKDEERKRVKRAPPQSRGGYTVAAISWQRGWNSQRTTTKILVFRPNSRSLSSWAAILIFAVERTEGEKSRPNLHSLSRSILGFFQRVEEGGKKIRGWAILLRLLISLSVAARKKDGWVCRAARGRVSVGWA